MQQAPYLLASGEKLNTPPEMDPAALDMCESMRAIVRTDRDLLDKVSRLYYSLTLAEIVASTHRVQKLLFLQFARTLNTTRLTSFAWLTLSSPMSHYHMVFCVYLRCLN